MRSALATSLPRARRALAALFVVASSLAAQSQPEGDGPWMVRAWFGDEAMKRDVASWGDHFADHPAKGFLSIEADAERLAALRALGFYVDQDDERTGWIRDGREAAESAAEAVRRGEAPLAGIPGYPCYRTVEESFATMQALATAHPTLASVVDAGDSWQKPQTPGTGYDLFVLKLTNSTVPGPKPKLFVTSAIHAREYTTAELVLRFAEELVAGHGVDADSTWLLDEHEIHLMVQTNPDGRKKAETGLSWRKNVNNNYCTDTNSRGADLNRNYSFQWNCCGGSSGDPCSLTYHGLGAASEPEIQAVQGYLRAIFPDQRGPALGDPAPADATGVFLDVHSYSQLILTPWGFSDPNFDPPPNGDAFRTAARKFAFLSGYDPSLFIYTVDGASDDFAYGDLGVAAFAWELGTAFFESCSSFAANILPEGLPMLRYAAKIARTPYLTPSGPDSLAAATTPLLVEPGDPLSIQATIDDARFSTLNGTEAVQPIAAAEAYLDLPPWRVGAAPIALAAVDGAFNETTEPVTGSLPTGALSGGRHILYVRGQDTSGAWGAVTATFFYVLDPASAPFVEGFVRDAASSAPLAATVTIGPFATSTNAGTGAYSIQVPPGTYDLEANAAGHARQTVQDVELSNFETHLQDFTLQAITTLLAVDGESGTQGWAAQTPWALTTEASQSPSHSWTDSPGVDYSDNANTALVSPLLDLSQATGVALAFSQLRDLEEGYDYGHVEYSTDGGGSWSEAVAFDGEGFTSTWEPVVIALPQLDGESAARIRFRLTSDVSLTFDGWHLDDIAVTAIVDLAWIFSDGFETDDLSRWSNSSP